MTDDKIELSRRKTLAALGTVGVASIGAGLGTSAYFSDEETFANNQLTAGSLDLKVDWEEHYSDWSADEAEGLENDVRMSAPEENAGDYTALPDPMNPLIWVHDDDLEQFMDNTSIEAFPDTDDDGVQDDLVGDREYDACLDGADTPEDLDPTVQGALRTLNEDTVIVDPETEETSPAPLINLDDVKPGDFGEATLSFHLCDNPGYVWLQGDLVEARENGHTEPEAEDPDEEGPEDEVITDVSEIPESDVELLDEIQTTWWYDDDGDNVIDGGAGAPVCVQLVLDSSGSMTLTDGDGVSRNQELKNGANQLAQEILDASDENIVGVTEFDSDANLLLSVGDADAQDLTEVQNAINSVDANGGTNIPAGINTADSDLANCPDGHRRIQIVVTDGESSGDPSAAADAAIGNNTDEIFAVGTGGTDEDNLEEFARPQDEAHIHFSDDLENLVANLSQIILGEKVFFRGSLGDALQALADGSGIPLDGNRATDFDELEDDPTDENRECYLNSVDHYVGFAWYLPVDHANEIQTDSVAFDLGFYTEQCRHNDGAGIGNNPA